MNINSKFLQLSTDADLITVLKSVINKVGLELNCVRVGIVKTFYADDLTADVLIANKKSLGIKKDGVQITQDYALIRAKICYCCPFITYPIEPGEECVLLFNDRELESWFMTGEVQPEAYQRMHALTDCIAIVGLRSLAQMIQIMSDTLHIFYGNSDIQITDSSITSNTTNYNINAETTITGNTFVIGNLNVSTGDSGTFTSLGGKTVTVKNGIITNIQR